MPTSNPVLNTPSSNVLAAASRQFARLYSESGQAMYIYLDDHTKSCNPRFAKLLGYNSPEEWAAVHTSFPQAFVAPESQEVLVDTYQNALNEGVANTVPVTWRCKDGSTVDTDVMLVPIDVEGRRVAVHFIEEA